MITPPLPGGGDKYSTGEDDTTQQVVMRNTYPVMMTTGQYDEYHHMCENDHSPVVMRNKHPVMRMATDNDDE